MFNSKEILICWIQRHVRLTGNEEADSAAKSTLDLTPDKFKIPYTDLKPKLIGFFIQNGTNTGIKTFAIRSS